MNKLNQSVTYALHLFIKERNLARKSKTWSLK